MILSGAYVLVLLMLGARIRRGMDREQMEGVPCDHRAGGLPSGSGFRYACSAWDPCFRMWITSSGFSQWSSLDFWLGTDDGIEDGGR